MHTDIALQQLISKLENPTLRHELALKHLQQHYGDALHIYTDGSTFKTGRTGAAYYIPSQDQKAAFRLDDNTSILTAELMAIKCALLQIQNTDRDTTKIAILSDSQTAIQLLAAANCHHKSIETEIADVITYLQRQKKIEVTIVWIPGHAGLQGNEIVDRLAKECVTKITIDIAIEASLQEIYKKIDTEIEEEWQNQYDKSPTGRCYKLIEPTVSRKIKYSSNNRKQETTITRLRLGKCHLNHYLHKINKHQTGLCDYCNIPETVEHFILHCPNSKIFFDNSTTKTLATAFKSDVNVNHVFNRIQQLRRRL